MCAPAPYAISFASRGSIRPAMLPEGALADAAHAHRHIEGFGVGVAVDLEARGARGPGRPLEMRPKPAAETAAEHCGRDEELRHFGHRPIEPQLIEPEHLTLPLDHMGRVPQDALWGDRQLYATGRHEAGVVAPYRLRGQREAGQYGGLDPLRAPDAGRRASVGRVGQRRWYCLLPNIISQAVLSVL
jgi:hypothetical protein